MLIRIARWTWNRIEMTRPHNLAVAVLTLFAGWAIAGGGTPDARLMWALLAGALVTAAGNVVNDYFDFEIDRINKPRRPIPSGRVSRLESRRYAAALSAAALLAGSAAGLGMALVVLVWTVLLHLYSRELKTRFLWGNLAVSLVSASGFVVGAWLAGDVRPGVLPALLAFLLLMGREIVKDVEDLPGDTACGARTLARCLGERRALGVALGFFVLFACLTPSPYWFELCGPQYLVTVLLGVLPLLVLASWLMLRDASPANLVRVSWILKIDMFVGVLGVYLGRVH
jgi:geranylgeranylglycerol-phosphate geranylgeranyltransferase